MEAVLVGSVIGAGYLLNQSGKNSRKTIENESVFRNPSQNSIYDSSYYQTSQNIEASLTNSNFQKAKNPLDTNVIAPQFNNSIFNKDTSPLTYLQQPDISTQSGVTSLTGKPLHETDFDHNNMVPFFGSHVRQNVATDSNVSILENHTGIENFSNVKREPIPLFDPAPNSSILFGTQNQNDDIQARFAPSVYRQNEIPFEKVQVGPGISQSYCAAPSGGFHPDVREYVLPKTIDELRPTSRPQITYNGRVVAGKAVVSKRDQIGQVHQYKPDTFYINNPDRYLTTTGAVTKETARSLYKISEKVTLRPDGPRNTYAKDTWKNNEFGDYGKSAVQPVSNERQTTGIRTHLTNFNTIVKAMIAPLLDVMKTTRKENAEGNIRMSGNMGSSAIAKNVVWDPNDVARTTIKETNIHDTRTSNIKVNNKGTVLDQETMRFRTTIKETNIHDTRTSNMRVIEKGTIVDEDEQARTTIRETTEDNYHNGHLNGPKLVGVIYDPDDIAKTTIKETLIHLTRNGNIGGLSKELGYLTNPMEAPNTHRQFQTDYEYGGIADGDIGGGAGYLTNEHEAPNTHRQFTTDYEYEGAAQSMYKEPMVYDTAYNARINVTKEGTLVGRYPTLSNVKLYKGKEGVNIEMKKIEGDQINTRELSSTKVYNSIKELKPCAVTSDRFNYDHKIMEDRIDPGLLTAFRENPYTKPLSSY